MTTVYTATVNDRFILKSSTLAGVKSAASRVANRAFRTEDRMVVTGRTGGELTAKLIFRRRNACREDRGEWVAMVPQELPAAGCGEACPA